jgi:hypothetical protein
MSRPAKTRNTQLRKVIFFKEQMSEISRRERLDRNTHSGTEKNGEAQLIEVSDDIAFDEVFNDAGIEIALQFPRAGIEVVTMDGGDRNAPS